MIFCVGESDDDPIIYWPQFFKQNASIETNAARALSVGSAFQQLIHFIEYCNQYGLVETAEAWMGHMREHHHANKAAREMGISDQQYVDSQIGAVMVAFAEMMSAMHDSIMTSIGEAHRYTDAAEDSRVIEVEGVGRAVMIPKHFISFQSFLEEAAKEFSDEGMMLKEVSNRIGDN